MGVIEPELGICVAKGRDVVGRHKKLLNCPSVDYVVSQSFQKVQPPCPEHVVREY